MREIGGYIELEQNTGKMLHDEAIALNCGRNCLLYLIRAKEIRKIALPYFLCDSVKTICENENVIITFYNVNDNFLPDINYLDEDAWLYVVDYYGQLKKKWIIDTANKFKNRVIIDNAQAYFEMPVPGVDTIYTCRKFFGVPDGAFLYTQVKLKDFIPTDESHDRMGYLLGRFERSSSEFYDEYVANNKKFATEPIKEMSKLTKNLLCGIDYERVKFRRTENYGYLFDALSSYNILKLTKIEGAYAYPLFLKNGADVRKKLIQAKIFIPILWQNVIDEVQDGMIEFELSLNILPLPCDQRYEISDMKYLVKEVMKCIS